MKIRPAQNIGSVKHHLTQEYRDYLASREWAITRQAALARARFRCQAVGCLAVSGLEVHHLRYDSLGAEAWGDLVVLCRTHHQDADRRRVGLRDLR